MKIATILVLFAFGMLGIAQAIGQQTAIPAQRPPGIVRSSAISVKAPPQRPIFQSIPLIATSSGTFVFKITIMVKSALPTSDVIECIGSASTFDVGRAISESAGVAAARAGGIATCTVMLPYAWSLNNSSTDMVSPSYSIQVPVSGTAALPNRFSTQTLVPIHVPPGGSTTTETISATI